MTLLPKRFVADGAYGTALRGNARDGRRVEWMNLEAPDAVLALARAYVAAGAGVLWTNTFGAALEGMVDDARRDAAVAAGVRIAREAADGRVRVLAALGPLRGDAAAGYASLAETAMGAGADGIVLETMTVAEDARAAAALLAGAGVPVAVTFTITVDAAGAARTLCGAELRDAARAVEDAGAMAAGVNCCDGPATVLAGVHALCGAVGVPIIARPNAGVDQAMDAEVFGAWGRRLFDAGASIVGGCCGTGPGHIAAVARALGTEGHGRAEGAPPNGGGAAPHDDCYPLSTLTPTWTSSLGTRQGQ